MNGYSGSTSGAQLSNMMLPGSPASGLFNSPSSKFISHFTYSLLHNLLTISPDLLEIAI